VTLRECFMGGWRENKHWEEEGERQQDTNQFLKNTGRRGINKKKKLKIPVRATQKKKANIILILEI